MNKRGLALLVSLVMLILSSGIAGGGVPCPSTSTVEARGDGNCVPDATVCPGGDLDVITVSIILRDCYGVPIEGYMVVVSPVQIEGYNCFCPGEESRTVGPTDVEGKTDARFASLGGCGAIHFSATVNTVEIGPSNVISVIGPDRDCDGTVGLIDFGFFATHYLTTDSCYNYDCKGIVDLVDFGIFALHYLHTCP